LSILNWGDHKIDTIKEKVIILLGLTGAGKSCIFNWILGHGMIGKGDYI